MPPPSPAAAAPPANASTEASPSRAPRSWSKAFMTAGESSTAPSARRGRARAARSATWHPREWPTSTARGTLSRSSSRHSAATLKSTPYGSWKRVSGLADQGRLSGAVGRDVSPKAGRSNATTRAPAAARPPHAASQQAVDPANPCSSTTVR
eukprot:CAMPEP_0194574490 /NCGR_PEP_ID=MMETSP0292-20121207/10319_1 /TAXON_ID=39354 /ORGANISM="Heterosigma akashiwo, Strain CCMP2393" /LENGTH=151 /DNA_ID=CAMNT_0039426019 /DNA_START=505 /DNA_END=960 /DNA_ORIENTATION=-